jgi:uncharacterized membrane protein
MKNIRFLVQAATIGAIYAALTLAFAPISFGHNIFQLRISEALTILPYFTPAAIPGLFVGCIVANIIGGFGILDIVFGSLATLGAALLSYKLRKYKILVPVPPVILNAIIVGSYLYYIFLRIAEMNIQSIGIIGVMGWVGLGEILACYALGYPLLLLLERYRKIFE